MCTCRLSWKPDYQNSFQVLSSLPSSDLENLQHGVSRRSLSVIVCQCCVLAAPSHTVKDPSSRVPSYTDDLEKRTDVVKEWMARGHHQEGICGLMLDLQESPGEIFSSCVWCGSPRAGLARIKNTRTDTESRGLWANVGILTVVPIDRCRIT